jgi:hypothetical protein
MSGLVKLVIHYGYGAVRSSDARADLSDFEYHEVEFTDPQSIRIGDFKGMLMVFLEWDRKLYTVSLQALWSNSSSNIYCQLKEIERTSQWVSWLKGCERRETSPIALVVAKPITVEGRPSQATTARQLVLVLGRACNQLMSLLWPCHMPTTLGMKQGRAVMY